MEALRERAFEHLAQRGMLLGSQILRYIVEYILEYWFYNTPYRKYFDMLCYAILYYTHTNISTTFNTATTCTQN